MHFMFNVYYTPMDTLDNYSTRQRHNIRLVPSRCIAAFSTIYAHIATNIENQFILRPNIKCVLATHDERWSSRRSSPSYAARFIVGRRKTFTNRIASVCCLYAIYYTYLVVLPPCESYGSLSHQVIHTHGFQTCLSLYG